jgi:two-component system LytT family response regulator
VVKKAEIIRIQADGSYVKISTNNKNYLSSINLKSILTTLSSKKFYRCHNSHVVNISKISKMGKGKGGYVVLTNEDIVPVSTSKLNGLSNLIGI